MNDTELLDWFEAVKAQAWYDKRTGLWTVFCLSPHRPGNPIQPSSPSLRVAMEVAHNETKSLA